MDSYGYPYPPPFPPMRPPGGDYPDHGDGYGDYYGMGPVNEEPGRRQSRSKHRTRKNRDAKRSRTRSGSQSKSRSRTRSISRSQSRSKSRSRTKSRSRSRSLSRSRSGGRHRDLSFKEPGFLDAFRVLYLTQVANEQTSHLIVCDHRRPRTPTTPLRMEYALLLKVLKSYRIGKTAASKHKKNTTKYLATQKRQDRIQEILKSDGLGSKKWLLYPRSATHSDTNTAEVPGSRDNCDQRVKVDGNFFRKCKRSKKIDSDAPIAKLKRWELMFYKKLGFIHAV